MKGVLQLVVKLMKMNKNDSSILARKKYGASKMANKPKEKCFLSFRAYGQSYDNVIKGSKNNGKEYSSKD